MVSSASTHFHIPPLPACRPRHTRQGFIQVQFSVSIISAHAFSVRHRFNEVQQAERERERQRQQRQSRLWLGSTTP